MNEQTIQLLNQVLGELRLVKEEVSNKSEDDERIESIIDRLDGLEDRLDTILDTLKDQEILR